MGATFYWDYAIFICSNPFYNFTPIIRNVIKSVMRMEILKVTVESNSQGTINTICAQSSVLKLIQDLVKDVCSLIKNIKDITFRCCNKKINMLVYKSTKKGILIYFFKKTILMNFFTSFKKEKKRLILYPFCFSIISLSLVVLVINRVF